MSIQKLNQMWDEADWYYDDPYFQEVERVEEVKVVVTWKSV